MTEFTDDQRRRRVLEWLEIIKSDVQDLVVDHHIFWKVQDMIRENPSLRDASSHFFQWMGTNFIAASALAVRRQSDNDKQAISLRRLLEELKAYPRLFSRQYHTSLYTTLSTAYADGSYDNIVGKGKNELDPAVIQAEVDGLISRTERIQHYADRRIAHYDPRGVKPPLPTFNDLGDAIHELEKLVVRYYLIMKAVWMDELMPTFQYEWQEVFYVPWMQRPPRGDE